MSAKAERIFKTQPPGFEAELPFSRSTCESLATAIFSIEEPPFFEIEPHQRPPAASRVRRWRSSVATRDEVLKWMRSVPSALEKAHKRAANWPRPARYTELQTALVNALPHLTIMAWIMRHPGSPADRLRTLLGDCLTELAEIPRLAADPEVRFSRLNALKHHLCIAAAARDRPFEAIADPYLGIADILYARSAAIILTMLVWSEP